VYLEQNNAVQSYIDALLFEPLLHESTTAGLPEGSGPPQSPITAAPVAQRAVPLTEHPAKTAPTADSAQITRSRAFVRHLELAQQGANPGPREANKRPAWASETVPCLIVKTANLKLAIPEQFIERVEPITETFDADSPAGSGEGKSSGSTLGTIAFKEAVQGASHCHLVDTAKLVMPERYSPEMREGYRHAIIMKELDWALAVDAIGARVDYASSKVRWRSLHTRREWLAGTVIADMCAIVDIDAIYRSMLADSVLTDSVTADATPPGRIRE